MNHGKSQPLLFTISSVMLNISSIAFVLSRVNKSSRKYGSRNIPWLESKYNIQPVKSLHATQVNSFVIVAAAAWTTTTTRRSTMKCHVLVVVVSLTSRLPFKVLEIHHCDVFALPLNWWRWWSAQVIVIVDGQLFIGKISISRRTFLVAVVSTVECGGRKTG